MAIAAITAAEIITCQRSDIDLIPDLLLFIVGCLRMIDVIHMGCKQRVCVTNRYGRSKSMRTVYSLAFLALFTVVGCTPQKSIPEVNPKPENIAFDPEAATGFQQKS